MKKDFANQIIQNIHSIQLKQKLKVSEITHDKAINSKINNITDINKPTRLLNNVSAIDHTVILRFIQISVHTLLIDNAALEPNSRKFSTKLSSAKIKKKVEKRSKYIN